MLKCDKTFDNGTSINFDGKVWFMEDWSEKIS